MGKKIIGVTVGTPIKPDLVGGGSGVDLSEYVKNTDYATNEKAGVVKVVGGGNGLNALPGQQTPDGGEIFNNYESNTANYRAHAEGSATKAQGKYSHAEGYLTEAKSSFAHAEGNTTKAHGNASHAEGNWTKATGKYSHVEGNNTTASGECAHAEGHYTYATGHASHAAGRFTVASAEAQYVIGEYNKQNKDAAFIVGNGVGDADSERSNAFEVYLDGHAEVQSMGETDKSVVTKQYIDNKLDTWELIEEITVTEEAVVNRKYTEKYKKIVVCAECADNLPNISLIYDNYYTASFDTYGEYQNRFIVVYGEIVIPNVYNNLYSWVGGYGEPANFCASYMPWLVFNEAEYYSGFGSDNVCKVGTTIKVYGVKS